jgi:hypothetical protein
LYCFMAKFKLLFATFSCCDAISIFDSKQNSLHSYFPEAIVIFLLCHQFGLQLLNIYFGFMDFMFSFKTSKYSFHCCANHPVWTYSQLI